MRAEYLMRSDLTQRRFDAALRTMWHELRMSLQDLRCWLRIAKG